MINFLLLMLLEAVAFVIGVWSVVDMLRRDEPDLYCEWMRRRDERRGGVNNGRI